MIKDPSKYIKIELANNTFMNLLAFGRLADHRFAAPAPSRHAAVSTRYFVADWLKEDVERAALRVCVFVCACTLR